MVGKTNVVNLNLETSHPEYSVAKRGIRSPEIVTLAANQVLFRFASTKIFKNGELFPSDSSRWANGPWWVLEEDYRKIVARFLQGKLSLGTTARSAVAVQPSWSLMDVSIKAYLIDDMQVFSGTGAAQYHDMLPNGMRMTLAGWSDITQIYVPNMRGPARSNIRVKRQKIISSHSFGW